MFSFSTTTTEPADLVRDSNSTSECSHCEELDEAEKQTATAHKHSPLYLDVWFDSTYNHHIFKRGIHVASVYQQRDTSFLFVS